MRTHAHILTHLEDGGGGGGEGAAQAVRTAPAAAGGDSGEVKVRDGGERRRVARARRELTDGVDTIRGAA